MIMEDLVGKKYGNRTIIAIVPHAKGEARKCLTKCDCGSEKVISIYAIQGGRSRMCKKCAKKKNKVKMCTQR